MKFTKLEIPDVILIEPKIFNDERGFFFESFRLDKLEGEIGKKVSFSQDNHSGSSFGVLRGLHYQLNIPQGKIIRVIKGSIFDVAVDLRQSSPYFGKWVGTELSSLNNRQIWIPEGFAHGFLTLTEETEILYKSTNVYSPEDERCILWNDSDLAIKWPLTNDPIMSEKDKKGSLFKDADYFN
jgi:dTDP-4-dehydrorhamnose 3,5-epimerase